MEITEEMKWCKLQIWDTSPHRSDRRCLFRCSQIRDEKKLKDTKLNWYTFLLN